MNFEREREIKKIYNCIQKEKKNLGINLSKKVKYLYIEKYKTPMRYIKENTSKLKDIPGSWAGRIKIVKTAILLCTTDLMQYLSKLQWWFSEK